MTSKTIALHWTILALLSLTILSLSVTIVAKLSFVGLKTTLYEPMVVLLLTEASKIILSIAMIYITKAPTPLPKDVVPFYYYALPAFMYSISNGIIFYTIGIISPGEFVLLWQSKFFTTALLYRFVLKRPVAVFQWFALSMVLVGVFILELSIDSVEDFQVATHNLTATTTTTTTTNTTTTTMPLDLTQATAKMSRTTAILITIGGATFASIAGVSAEWVYKKSTESIWRQNARIACASFLFYIVSSLFQSKMEINLNLMFQGFNVWCIWLIFFQSLLGFGVGFILKYFDVILGLQSAAAALILNIIVSIQFFDLKASPFFFVGGKYKYMIQVLFVLFFYLPMMNF